MTSQGNFEPAAPLQWPGFKTYLLIRQINLEGSPFDPTQNVSALFA